MRSSGKVLAAGLVALAAGCSSSSSASPPPLDTAPPAVAPSPSASPTPRPTPSDAVADRLAWTSGGHVHVVSLTSRGARVGAQVDLGAVSDHVTPTWSPKGRYLSWTSDGDTTTLHVWDSREAHETTVRLGLGLQTRAGGTGARALDEQSGALQTLDRTGKAVSTTQLGAGDEAVSLAPDPAVLLEPIREEAAGADLVLRTASGGKRVVGHVGAVPFLGTNTPRLSSDALSPDGAAMVVATELGQDGACAPRAVVHRVPLTGSARETATPLPPVAGQDEVEVRSLSLSDDGTVGAVLVQCLESGAAPSAYVELSRGRWVTVATGVAIGTRAPSGLLAEQTGGLSRDEGGDEITTQRPLQVLDASGAAVLSLPSAVTAAWAPTAAG